MKKLGMNLQKSPNFGLCAHLKQNILQFTTESGLKSSLIVKKRFCSKV